MINCDEYKATALKANELAKMWEEAYNKMEQIFERWEEIYLTRKNLPIIDIILERISKWWNR